MSELSQPINGRLDAEPIRKDDENTLQLQTNFGAHVLVPTLPTEGGTGMQATLELCKAPNRRDHYCVGGSFNRDQMEGSEYYDKSERNRYLTVVESQRENQNTKLFAGIGKSGNTKTVELGKQTAKGYTFNPDSNFAIRASIYANQFVAIPQEDRDAETASLVSLQVGAQISGMLQDKITTPSAHGISDYDIATFYYNLVHNFGQSWGMKKSLGEPSTIAADFSEDFFGDSEGLPGAKEEGTSSLQVATTFLGGFGINNELSLFYAARPEQRPYLYGGKIVATAAHCIASGDDKSSTMLTQCLVGGSTLLDAALPPKELWTRAAKNGALFLAGWAMQKEKAGGALQSAGMQDMVALGQDPNPGETGSKKQSAIHAAYRWNFKTENGQMGFETVGNMDDIYAFSSIFFQSSPIDAEPLQEWADDITTRDALTETPEAQILAGIGIKKNFNESIEGGIGAHTLLNIVGSETLPGIGLDGRLTLKIGNENKPGAEFGGSVQPAILSGGIFQASAIAFAGAHF